MMMVQFCAMAQTTKDVELCLKAEEAYRIGRFDEAVNLLESNLNELTSRTRETAYRLLTLCYMEKDQNAKAQSYAELLLKENPYFTVNLSDPIRFADMVENMKRGKSATITTASQQAETIEEAPVPVTLITEEMIKASGAKNLQEVIAAFVPGISVVEGNQLNVSMHGIYSSTQEKILVMLNGHRLNSRTTNSESLDFRNSLEKIKQIEVLRGPASSLYGNVALTAVINIITKSGNDVDGIKVSYGMGDCSTYKADLLFGKKYFNFDVLAWASFYSSAGERRIINCGDKDFLGIIPIDGYAMLGGFNNKPSYDMGFNIEWGNFKLLFSQQYSKKVIPYTSAAFNPTIYDYYRYRDISGIKPGNGRETTRGEISYSQINDKLSWEIKAFIDREVCNNYDVSGDTLNDYDSYYPIDNLIDEYTKDSALIQTTGVYQALEWEDLNYGISAQTSYNYGRDDGNHGSVLLGGQAEWYEMKNNSFLLGDEFDRIDLYFSDRNRKISLGKEWNASAYCQVKHYFSKHFIVNGGLRFDYKHRFNNNNISALSPRLSLIYNPGGKWNFKLGYSRAFVDAPFFYRANKTRRYMGAGDLKPEYLTALSLSASAKFTESLSWDVNLYYNKVSDVIFHDSNIGRYVNSGKAEIIGVENCLSFSIPSFMSYLNCSLMSVCKSENFYASGSRVYDLPTFNANLTSMYRIINIGSEQNLWVNMSVSACTNQLSPQGPYYIDATTEFSDPNYANKGRVLMNAGLIYNVKRASLSCQVYNLFNKHYSLGASSYNYDTPQQGRNFIASLSLNI